jgi:hypothetical protein
VDGGSSGRACAEQKQCEAACWIRPFCHLHITYKTGWRAQRAPASVMALPPPAPPWHVAPGLPGPAGVVGKSDGGWCLIFCFLREGKGHQ